MEQLYKHLIDDDKGPVSFEYAPPTDRRFLKFKSNKFPWSIVSKEFNFLFEKILSNDLKRGFEACTGIGLSALAAGLAMKLTGGKIVTIDAYIEEQLNTDGYHSNNIEKNIFSYSNGYKNINYLIDKFKLKEYLFAEVGWSPDDIPKTIEKHFNEPLDYIFIDSGHTEEQLLTEIKCLIPYSNYDTMWLFHDVTTNMWTDNVENFCRKNLRKIMSVKLSHFEGCSNLGILEKYE